MKLSIIVIALAQKGLSCPSLIMTQQARRPLEPHADRVNKSKSNLYYTRGITPKRVTSSGAHLRCFALEQHSSEETSKRWQAVGDTVSDLTEPGIESQTSRTDSVRLTTVDSWLWTG